MPEPYVEQKYHDYRDSFREDLWDLVEGMEAEDDDSYSALRELLERTAKVTGIHRCTRQGCQHSAADHFQGKRCRTKGCSCPAWRSTIIKTAQEIAWESEWLDRCRNVYDDPEDRTLTQCRLVKDHVGNHQNAFDMRQLSWPQGDPNGVDYR